MNFDANNTSINLLKGEPNNWNGQEDCHEYFSIENHANDISCNKLMCMICQIPTNTLFHLQGCKMSNARKLHKKMCLGICEDSNVDAFYVLKPENNLLGFIRSKMVWSGSRWEIYDLVNDSLSKQNIDNQLYD